MSIAQELRAIAAQTATEYLGLIPHLLPLVSAIGPFGLEPRLRELAVLAVMEGRGCRACGATHRTIGWLAGLTEPELYGDLSGLTAAERSAVFLALGTVSRLPEDFVADQPDHHFTPLQLRQLEAVALAAKAACNLGRAAQELRTFRSGLET